MVILDTSVIIDHLRRPAEESVLVKLYKKSTDQIFGISVVSVQELYEGKSTKDATKESQLLSVLGLLEVLPYNLEVAKLAGEIARDAKRPIELADAAIAATVILNEAELYTLNTKHFGVIPGLRMTGEDLRKGV